MTRKYILVKEINVHEWQKKTLFTMTIGIISSKVEQIQITQICEI